MNLAGVGRGSSENWPGFAQRCKSWLEASRQNPGAQSFGDYCVGESKPPNRPSLLSHSSGKRSRDPWSPRVWWLLTAKLRALSNAHASEFSTMVTPARDGGGPLMHKEPRRCT